jgi:SAM-dependent methyltransferase
LAAEEAGWDGSTAPAATAHRGLCNIRFVHEPLDQVVDHYSAGDERERLTTPLGVVEFERTREVVLRSLPPAPAVVADIGGGPGRYALWLSGEGYTVHHRDPVPLHVAQLKADAVAMGLSVDTAQGDARAIDLADASADAVLLLGPLYHLPRRPDRLRALSEARRVVRQGGSIFVAGISRWAPRLHGEVALRLGERFPNIAEQVALVERTGVLTPLFPGSFSGYCHRPQQLRAEIRAARLSCVDLVSLEGIAFALEDLEERLADPQMLEVVMGAARATEHVQELLGIGPHLLATARRLA